MRCGSKDEVEGRRKDSLAVFLPTPAPKLVRADAVLSQSPGFKFCSHAHRHLVTARS